VAFLPIEFRKFRSISRPQPHDVERYKTICEAYKANLPSQTELLPDIPLSEQMITYWPILEGHA